MQQNALINTLRTQDRAINDIRQGLRRIEFEFGIKREDREQQDRDPRDEAANAATAIKAINIVKDKAMEEIQDLLKKLEDLKTSNESLEKSIRELVAKEVNDKLEEGVKQQVSNVTQELDTKLTESYNEINSLCEELKKKQEEGLTEALKQHQVQLQADVDKQIVDIKKQSLEEYKNLSIEFEAKVNSVKEYLNKVKENNDADLNAKLAELKLETNKTLEEFEEQLNQHIAELSLASAQELDERKLIDWEKIKAVVIEWFEKLKEEFKEKIWKKQKELIKEEIKKFVIEQLQRELPQCDIRIVDYDDAEDNNEGKNGPVMKINGVSSLEVDNGTITIDRYLGLECNGTCISNTIDDQDFIAVVAKDSKYHGEDLKGRYVDLCDIDEDSMLFTIGLDPNNENLTSKVIAVVKEPINPSIKEVVYKHHIMNLDPKFEYAVIAISGLVEVRVADDTVRIGEVLVPNGDGLYTNKTTTNRFLYTTSNCIPKVRVLKVVNQDYVLGYLAI